MLNIRVWCDRDDVLQALAGIGRHVQIDGETTSFSGVALTAIRIERM